MTNVMIDPGVLAAPPLEAEAEVVHQYVDSLLDWRQLLDEPWISIYVSERASELLIEEGLFPLRNALKKLFTEKGIVEYDVNTVVKVAERLLQLTPSFETYFRVSDVLTEDLTTEPELLALTVGKYMASDLGRCIVLLSILHNHCRDISSECSLILRNTSGASQITLKALVHSIEH